MSSEPPRRSAAAVLAVGLVLGGVAALGPGLDTSGRAAAGLVAAVLALTAAAVGAVGSAVRADSAGLDVLVGLHRRRLSWEEVEVVREDARRRSRGLEIDLGEELIVVPSYLFGEPDLDGLVRALEQLRLAAAPWRV